MKLPRLEWVIWGISPRIFNRKWGDSAAGIRNSSGYWYDQEHPLEKQWRPFAGESVKPAGEAWGFAQNTKRNLNDYRARFENKADMDKLRQQVQKVDFELARNRLDMFEQILAGLKPRRIRVLGFTPPMHRAIADQPATDDNGVSQEGCDQIVKALQEMARKHDNFVFLDIDRKTHNDFENDDFYNFDHLSAQGAAKLTKMLDAEIAKFQETKEERQ